MHFRRLVKRWSEITSGLLNVSEIRILLSE